MIPYSFGLRFAQQSRQEYQQLRPDMIKIIEISGTRSQPFYNGSGSKENHGEFNERCVQVRPYIQIMDRTQLFFAAIEESLT